MSTRSVIARKTEGGWEGRYCHSDGYPSGVGKDLFGLWNGHFAGRPFEMLNTLIDEHEFWSHISGDWNKDPGFIENLTRWLEADPSHTWETKPPACYCHGERNETGGAMYHSYEEDREAYLYVIDPCAETMSIYCVDNGDKLLATVNLAGPEPEWEKIQGW